MKERLETSFIPGISYIANHVAFAHVTGQSQATSSSSFECVCTTVRLERGTVLGSHLVLWRNDIGHDLFSLCSECGHPRRSGERFSLGAVVVQYVRAGMHDQECVALCACVAFCARPIVPGYPAAIRTAILLNQTSKIIVQMFFNPQ